MNELTSEQIREAFLSYFESNDHLRVASSSLIPVGDPTLLLTSAGMVQFKPFFAGEAEPPNKRLTSSQKSFRAVDIDEVGDATHLTMFEMLGNFSIGDYFKQGAIDFALECLAKGMGLPQEKFAITVHTTDDEAEELWQNAGVPKDRIWRFGDADNWWGPAGDEGPCGPCSELHYDFGAQFGCLLTTCGPNCENIVEATGETCGRFVELWNLVFMQYYHHLDGTRTPLPAPSVDTGMGLERLVVVLQGARDIYDTDLFRPVIEKLQDISGKSYGGFRAPGEEPGPSKDEPSPIDIAMRVVSEHARSATFLIADGVVPGNEGRGYVLRRVIRRAIRFGRRLGLEEAFLGDIADVVIKKMGPAYPELTLHDNFVKTVLKLEEDRFQQVFLSGNAFLAGELDKGGDLAGELAFKLWDTYGFPLEITSEIARERGVEVDVAGFEAAMEAQRERGRAAGKFGGDRSKIKVYESLAVGATVFLGYGQLAAETVVVGLIADDEVVGEVTEGQTVEIVLRETPFYPEGGGQVGDAGEVSAPNGELTINDTQTVLPGLIVHFGEVKQGTVRLGETVSGYVHPVRREDTARNHTATHLVHAALRQVLGTHVRQAGSHVAPDRLRFDFTHPKAVDREEMELVQRLVNEKIRANARVQSSEDEYTHAIERGALAFFGDKYEAKVRLVEIANGTTFSFEVCGGTHVRATGEIGTVYVLTEQSIGSGIRRLEAVSGRNAERTVWDRFGREERVARALETSAGDVEERVRRLMEENDRLRREVESASRANALQSAAGLLDAKQDISGVAVIAARAGASDSDGLREVGDWLRSKLGSGVVVVGAVLNDRPQIVAMVTKDLIERGLDASTIARGAAKVMQGGGGGRPDVAQAGGKLADKLDDALAQVPGLVKSGLVKSGLEG
jgi:alanyl-tRNA synthetase